MSKLNIAVIGLGKGGSAFVKAILSRKKTVNLACAVEIAESPGKAEAAAAGVKIATMDELIAMGKDIDIVFDLSGNPSVVKELRHKIMSAFNSHTVIASDIVAELIWALIIEE